MFNPIERNENVLEKNVKAIHLSIPYKYRTNMKDKQSLKRVEFKIRDIIKFWEDNDFGLMGDYRIIGARSYKFDEKAGTYLMVNEKINNVGIEKTHNKLIPGDYIQKCWLSRGEWATPQAEFCGYKKLKEGLVSWFQYKNGTQMYFHVSKGGGPETIFFVQSIKDCHEVELIEKQMLYYYNSHG